MAGKKKKEYKFNAIVIGVIDADTMDVQIDLGFNLTTIQRIRIADYDAPETFRPRNENERKHGKEATEYATELLLNKDVIIRTDKRGEYGRSIATIELVDSIRIDLPKEKGGGTFTFSDYRNIMIAKGFEKREEY